MGKYGIMGNYINYCTKGFEGLVNLIVTNKRFTTKLYVGNC